MEDKLTAGDVVALIVGIVAAVIAIVSVAIAIRANGIAKDANLEARQANEEAAKANRIAEEALEVQKTALPPAWSGMIQVSRSKVAFENQSGRNIVVTRIDAVPGGTRQMVQYTTEPPTRVEYGDTYEVMVIRAMGGSPEALKLHWHFEDETETQIAERRL